MASWLQSQCSIDRWMSLTARWRVPHPVRPKTNYDSKVLWSWMCPEISSYQSVKIGRMGRGYHLLGWTLNIWNCNGWNRFNKTWKKPTWIGTGEVLPKNKGDFLLDFVLVLSNLSTDISDTDKLRYHTFKTDSAFHHEMYRPQYIGILIIKK